MAWSKSHAGERCLVEVPVAAQGLQPQHRSWGWQQQGQTKLGKRFSYSLARLEWWDWAGLWAQCLLGDPFLSPALEAAAGDLALSHSQQRGQSSACSWELTLGLELPMRTGNYLSSNGIQASRPPGAVLAPKPHPAMRRYLVRLRCFSLCSRSPC